MQSNNIMHISTTTYHPQSNPVGHYNTEIGRVLRIYFNKDHAIWNQYLHEIIYLIA